MEKKAVSGIVLMLLLTSMLSSAFIIQPVKAGTIIVPDHYPTIQEAINAASPGDTIYVRAGTYYECLTINKALTLVGEDRSTTVIDGNRTGTVVTITANYVTLSGFTIQRSKAGWKVSGVYLTANHSIITDNNIENNYEGIYLLDSKYNSIFGNNITGNDADGIAIHRSSNNNVYRNNIVRTRAFGIALIQYSNNNSISGNNITATCAGILLWGTSNNRIFHNNFVNNTWQAYPQTPQPFDRWDDGYPSGGNYWSDYEERYPDAEELDDSGIWDTPYIIDVDNQDRYPLVHPWRERVESPWPMFQHDPQHTGRSPFVGPKSEEPEARVLVEGEGDNDYFLPPVIGSDGTLYLGARITKGGLTKEGLFAINPDGTEKWFYGISNPHGTPALFQAENIVYILSYGTEFGGISAVDTMTGNLRWRKSFATLYGAQNPVIGENGILYFIAGCILPDESYDSCLFALDKNSEIVWVYAIEKGETYFDFQLPDEGSAGLSSPGPASVVTIDIEGTIYFGYEDTLFALNPDGTKKWQRTFEGEHPNIPFAPVISSSGVLYVLVNGISYTNYVGYCRLYALNPDGNSLWETTLAESFRSPPAIGPDGTLYVSIFWFGGRYQIWPIWLLTAVDTQGQLKWQVWPGNTGLSKLIVDAEGNVFALRSYTVAGYNPNGILLWSFGVTGASLALNYDGTLLVSGKKLYAIRDLPPAPPTQPPQPNNILPADGATDVSLTPELCSSPPLQDVDKELIPWEEIDGLWVTRVDSQWQITIIQGDYSDPVYDKTILGLIGRYSFPEVWSNWVDPEVLDYGTTYYWRVRYKDFRGVWSPWSEETSFTTTKGELFFTYTPQKPIVGESITFNAPTYGWIVSYEWNFGDGSPPAHEQTVIHSYSEANDYTVTLTLTDNEGVTTSISRTVKVTETWRFAIITDLHIGYCYTDYGTSGWDDGGGGDYWLTNRLCGIVKWINENEWTYNIHFVVVLGDIADTAEYSEFLKAREILNNLNVPYIPLIGNHDIWPYIQEDNRACWRDVRPGCIKEWAGSAVGDQFFDEVFWQQNKENVYKIKAFFGTSWERQVEQEEYTDRPYMQNYVFIYKGIKFIALDFIDRNPKNPPESGGAVLHPETRTWLTENLGKEPAMPTILLSHHPMFYDRLPIWGKLVGFNKSDAENIKNIIEGKNVQINFAGHNHRTAETTGSVTGIKVVTTEAVCRESCALSPGVDRTGRNIRIARASGDTIDHTALHDIDPTRSWDETKDFLESKCYWYAMVKSPVDLIVSDPDGFTLTKEIGEVAGMFYLEFDVDDDGELDDMILSGQLKMGDYQITVLPEPGASPTDTFTLAVGGLDAITILAENVSISDIPAEPYIVGSATLMLNIPPTTLLDIGEPKFVLNGTTYLTSATPIELIAEDNLYGSGLSSTAYRIYNATYDTGWTTHMQPHYLTGLSDGTYQIDYNSTDFAGNVEPTNTATIILDNTPPTTTLTIGEPNFVTDMTYVTLETPFKLETNDNTGSGVYSTAYRIYNSTYDSGWLPYTASFYLTALADGVYTIEFSSTDNVGNVEPSNTATVILDNIGPSVTIVNPPVGWALQDGVTFTISAIDAGSGVSSVSFSIREENGGEGTPVGFEDLPATYNATTGKWTLFFDTLQLPDGYYEVLVKAEDNLGNIASTIVPYSTRNWAVIELLPASETNKAGRTMPVKFSLRVAASVDPNQPFVYNEDLTIQIYDMNDPSNILQTAKFGDTARDYRIDIADELYITNFRTLKTPTTYIVAVYRKEMLIDTFEFSTVK